MILEGTINRIRFQNQDSGWTVAELETGESIVGVLFGVVAGMDVTMTGEWDTHPKFGSQFKVTAHRAAKPSTVASLTIYLQEMVYGIGPHLAQMITGHYGTRTPQAMDSAEMLKQVQGIGSLKASSIVKSWQEHEAERAVLEDLLAFFVENGLPTSLAHKAFKAWKFAAVEKLNDNPYVLMELEGVAFKKADAIALRLGYVPTAPKRVDAALEHVLAQATRNGNCYLTTAELHSQARDLLQIKMEHITGQVYELASRNRVVIEGDAVYLRRLFRAEIEASLHLKRLQGAPTLNVKLDKLPGGIAYTETQAAAIRATFESKVSIITGGPGTGKTTITKAIVELAEGKAISLCSPTGKAAKRLAQATGRDASTIHRLLGTDEEGHFIHDADDPIPADLVIVDEASMLDISLARHLLAAIHENAHVVFVGDIDQLPAVGPGNVLRDIIKSETVPVTRLDTIFRQGEHSLIIPNAHAINNGQAPAYCQGLGGDFYLDAADDAAAAQEKIVQLVTERIPKAFGYDPKTIQVLTPMHKGQAGDNELNTALQNKLNPQSPNTQEIRAGFVTLRVNDPVIQCKNNYEKGIFNGDQGVVKRIGENDTGKQAVWIEFDRTLVEFKPGDLSNLRLAYAITVHKSQGSEFPVVVMPVLTQHYVMLQRNLLYTAVTRAQKLAVIVGNPRAVGIAVHNNKTEQRNTKLAERLRLPSA